MYLGIERFPRIIQGILGWLWIADPFRDEQISHTATSIFPTMANSVPALDNVDGTATFAAKKGKTSAAKTGNTSGFSIFKTALNVVRNAKVILDI